MKVAAKVLILEDSPEQILLISNELAKAGLDCVTRHVEGREAFTAALDDFGPDLIISDYCMPDFTGMEALTLVRDRIPQVPFLVFSGSIDEETAVACMKAGASDYVLKTSYAKIGPAAMGALENARVRREKVQAEEALRRSEDQLRQVQKMQAIGRLAGGIAHDFNNVLTAILSYAELLQTDIPRDHVAADHVQELKKAAERAASLTRQLLAFSHQQPMTPVVLDLNRLVGELEKMLCRLIGETIEVRFQPAFGLGRVKADRSQLEQVIVNLAVNARDAMPKGGRLTLATSNLKIGSAQAAIDQLPAGDYVQLSIADSGAGMPPEVQKHLFEPFFTTKPLGKGTGLGLATSYAIATQNGGFLRFRSSPGEGTTFRILLPQVRAGEGEVSVSEGRLLGITGGSERILVAEDEEMVRKLTCRMLQNLGYTVFEAANGLEAVRLLEELSGEPPLDLLITDVVMPEMGGAELAEWVRAKRPDLRILFSSGYIDDQETRRDLLGSDRHFLPKPFTPTILARKVRQVLETELDRPPR